MSREAVSPTLVAPEPPPEFAEETVPALRRPAGLPTHLSLPMQVAALAVWPLLEQILGFLVGFVDTSVAGHLLSTESTNAVGGAVYILWLMQLLIGSAGVGATALLARAAGAGRWRRANAYLGQAMLVAAVWGLAMGVAFYVLAPAIGSLSGLRGENLRLCTIYLRLLALAAPCSALLGIGAACLRGSGDTRTPFLTMVLVNVVNIAACLLFVAPWSPIGGHGIRGLAFGTVLAWSVGALCLLGVLVHGRGNLRLRRRFLHPQAERLKRIVRVGFPNMLEGCGMWIGNYLVLMIVGRLSQEAIGAHFVAVRLEALSFMPGFALGISAATLVGQYLGAGDPRTARRAAWWCWLYGAGLMTFTGLFFVWKPEFFVSLVTDKEVFLRLSPQLLGLAGHVQIGFGTALVFSAVLRGAGDTRTATLLTYGSTFLVRLPAAYLLGVVLDGGLYGVWVALCIELLFRGALFMAFFLRGGWAKVRV